MMDSLNLSIGTIEYALNIIDRQMSELSLLTCVFDLVRRILKPCIFFHYFLV
jgi:hypothetical protein